MASLSDQMAQAGYQPKAGSLSSQMAQAGIKPIAPVTPAPDANALITNRGPLGNLFGNLATAGRQLGDLTTKIPGVKTIGNVFGTAMAYHGVGTGMPAPDANQKAYIKSTMPTPKQAIGGFIQAASVPASIAAAPVSIPASIATGALFGAAQGAGGAMEDNASTGQIVKQGTIGGVIGGVTGGVLSSVPVVAGAIKNKVASTLTSRAEQGITEALTPKLPPTKYRATGKAGQLDNPGVTSQAGVGGDTPQVKTAVDAVHQAAVALDKKPTDIIQTGPFASVTSNINRVKETIGDYSKSIVQPFLKSNPVQTNFEDFIGYMKQVKPPQAIASDTNAAGAFNRVRERVINEVYNSVKAQSKASGEFGSMTDPNIYWNARKKIDDIINEELGAKTLSDPARTGIKAAAQSLRGGTADFISDMLRFPGQMEQLARMREVVNTLPAKVKANMGPEEYNALAKQMGLNPTGAQLAAQWDAHMSTLTGLYKASDNLSTKVSGEQGKNLVQIFAKKHPVTANAIKYGGGALVGDKLLKSTTGFGI